MKSNHYFILFVLLFVFSVFNIQAQHIDAGDGLRVSQEKVNIQTNLSENDKISQNVTTIQPTCRVPQAISPNGDGYNDQWFLDCFATNTGIDKVEIFDRRGVLVYEKSNYTNEFVGKNNNGVDLPAATYYYLIKLKDGKKLTGWLYIAR